METIYNLLGIALASLTGGLAGYVTILRQQNQQLSRGYQASLEEEANLRQLYEADRKRYAEDSNELRGFIVECHQVIRERNETITTLKDCLKGARQLHDN